MTPSPTLPAAAGPSWQQLQRCSGLPMAEARLLLAHASGRPREWLIAHGDEAAEPGAAQAFEQAAAARRAGQPIAYLVGHREFFGRLFVVTPAVLIPRPETEDLVQRALAAAPHGARVLDLGTGSGAIAVTLAAERPDLRVVATDVSAAALAVAQRNAQRLPGPPGSAPIDWRLGDWWQALSAGERFQVIVSNPPYIAADDAHLSRGDLRFEPAGALASGADGLQAIRTLVAGAPSFLEPGGRLLMEHGFDQGPAVRTLLAAAGWLAIETAADLSGHPRITSATRPSGR